MKYVLAFALIAVAMALPEPIRLLEPVQLPDAIAPLTVPQEVMDDVALKVKVVDAPAPEAPEAAADFAVKIVDAPASEAPEAAADFAVKFVDAPASEAPEAADDFAVHFVDEAVNVDAPVAAEAADNFAVKFVDEAVNVEVPAAEAPEATADFAVKIVDAPAAEALVDAVQFVDAPVENDASDYAVHFVDEAINAPEANVVDTAANPILIKIVDLPLPGSVVMPLMVPNIGNVQLFDSHVEGNADFVVKVVDVADVDEVAYRPIKQYPNPMWR